MNGLEAFLENLLPEGVVGPVSENRMVVTILSGIVGKAFVFSKIKSYISYIFMSKNRHELNF